MQTCQLFIESCSSASNEFHKKPVIAINAIQGEDGIKRPDSSYAARRQASRVVSLCLIVMMKQADMGFVGRCPDGRTVRKPRQKVRQHDSNHDSDHQERGDSVLRLKKLFWAGQEFAGSSPDEIWHDCSRQYIPSIHAVVKDQDLI